MTDKQAFEMIAERAEALANDSRVKAAMRKLYESGATMEEVKATVYRMAVATLCGANK